MCCPNAFAMAPCSESRCELLLQLKDSIPWLYPHHHHHHPPFSLLAHHNLCVKDSLLGLMVPLQLSAVVSASNVQGWTVCSLSAPQHCQHVYFILRKMRSERSERELRRVRPHSSFFLDFFKYLHSSLMSPWRVVTYNQSLQMPLGPAQLQRAGEPLP